jgi:hypothetical protein
VSEYKIEDGIPVPLPQRKTPAQLVAALVEDIAAGIRVLRTRDGKPVTDEECEERARNICTSILLDFAFEKAPSWTDASPEVRDAIDRMLAEAFDTLRGKTVPEWSTPLIAGRPVGHSWSCRCPPCEEYKVRTTVGGETSKEGNGS